MTLNTSLIIDGDASGAKRASTEAAGALRQTETAVRAAGQSAKITTLETERLQRQLVATGTAGQAAGAGLGRVVSLSGAGRFVLQNTAAQLGDVAIQLESGTGAARVLGQQLPQLLGGFGALGGVLGTVAPLLGLLAAVGIPIASVLFGIGRGADDAKDKVETFAQELKTAQTATEDADRALVLASVGGLEDARKKYGEVTDAVKGLLDAQKDLKRLDAIDLNTKLLGKLSDPAFVDGIAKRVGDVGAVAIRGNEVEISVIEQSIASLESQQRRSVERTRKSLGDEAFNNIQTSTGQVPGRSPLLDQQIDEQRARLALLKGDIANAGSALAGLKVPPELLQSIVSLRTGLATAIKAGDFRSVVELTGKLRENLIAAGEAANSPVVALLTESQGAAQEIVALFDKTADATKGATTQTKDQKDAIDKLRDSMDLEIALLRAGTPELQEQVKLRRQLKDATADQSFELTALNAILRAEKEINQTGDALAALEKRNAELKRTPLENARARAVEGLGANASDEKRADAIRLAEENFRLEQSTRGRSARAKKEQIAPADALIGRLQGELDLLRETDPVQRELIRNRTVLAEATETERAGIEALIGQLAGERQAVEANADAYNLLRDSAAQALDDLIIRGSSAKDVVEDLVKSLLSATAKGALLGEGPLGELFGGGVLGGLFPAKKAAGGMINGPGGPRDDRVPILASNGEFVVNARATSQNRALLEAINAGALPRRATGGPVGASRPVALSIAGAANASAPPPPIRVEVIMKSDLLDARIDARSEAVAGRISQSVAGQAVRVGLDNFSANELPQRLKERDFGQVIG